MKKATKQALVSLRELRTQSGEVLYDRVKLAHQVLSDHDYISDEFSGDEFRARDYLTREFFHGWLDVNKLLEIFALFPAKKQWEERSFNLDQLYSEVVSSSQDFEKEERTVKRPRVTKQEFDELQYEKEEAEARAAYLQTQASDKDALIAELRNRVSELEKECSELRGRVAELHEIHREVVA